MLTSSIPTNIKRSLHGTLGTIRENRIAIIIMNKEILNNESCPKSWAEMTKTGKGRLCLNCKIKLSDLSELTIEKIAKNHYGRGKCVALTNDQIDLIMNYKRIKTIAIASSLFIGTTFFNLSYGQTVQKTADSCLVKGKAIGIEKEKLVNRQIYIYLKDSDSIYETKTDENGEFSINLPKNTEIEYSNVPKLISKKTRNRSSINIRRAKIQTIKKRVGYF